MSPNNRTLRYMNRFACIGPDCEDDCCHGAPARVDPESYDRLEKAVGFSPKPMREKFSQWVQIVEPHKDPARRDAIQKLGRRAKRLQLRPAYSFKLNDEGACGFQACQKID